MATTKKTTKTTKTAASTKKAMTTAKKLTATERAKAAEARAKRAEAKMERLKQESIVSKQVNGFIDFLREQSVVGLAIGLVLGTQAKALVDQLVLSFLNPLTGLLLPGEGTLKQKVFEVSFNGKAASFGWGAFVSSFLTFVLVAAIVYYVFKGLHLDKLDKPQKDQ
ncbi:MAG TPA: MscL family protein [Candidatus Saccharimonadales bacterium]|nr:MscL family protein [Candidatus Saccharimonadales bacterium]